MIAQGKASPRVRPWVNRQKHFKPCRGGRNFNRERRQPREQISGGGGEGFFEDGLEEVGGVGARVRQLRRQQSAAIAFNIYIGT